jgi:hypothetical protein
MEGFFMKNKSENKEVKKWTVSFWGTSDYDGVSDEVLKIVIEKNTGLTAVKISAEENGNIEAVLTFTGTRQDAETRRESLIDFLEESDFNSLQVSELEEERAACLPLFTPAPFMATRQRLLFRLVR